MKFATHWLFLAVLWIVLSAGGFAGFIKYDWDKTLQNYQEEFDAYRIEKKAFKLQFRRVPPIDYMWRYRYITEETKKVFSDEEFECLKDKETCTKQNREQLCERLQAFPKINTCFSLEHMRNDFMRFNDYMDRKSPPQKPTFENYKQSNKIRHIILGLLIVIPPILIFAFRDKLK